MAITVRDALQIGILVGAKVVAGETFYGVLIVPTLKGKFKKS